MYLFSVGSSIALAVDPSIIIYLGNYLSICLLRVLFIKIKMKKVRINLHWRPASNNQWNKIVRRGSTGFINELAPASASSGASWQYKKIIVNKKDVKKIQRVKKKRKQKTNMVGKWLFSFHKIRPSAEGRIMRPACHYAGLKKSVVIHTL